MKLTIDNSIPVNVLARALASEGLYMKAQPDGSARVVRSPTGEKPSGPDSHLLSAIFDIARTRI